MQINTHREETQQLTSNKQAQRRHTTYTKKQKREVQINTHKQTNNNTNPNNSQLKTQRIQRTKKSVRCKWTRTKGNTTTHIKQTNTKQTQIVYKKRYMQISTHTIRKTTTTIRNKNNIHNHSVYKTHIREMQTSTHKHETNNNTHQTSKHTSKTQRIQKQTS